MQHDWFMYHLRSNYKYHLEFPFNYFSCLKCGGGDDDDDEDYEERVMVILQVLKVIW